MTHKDRGRSWPTSSVDNEIDSKPLGGPFHGWPDVGQHIDDPIPQDLPLTQSEVNLCSKCGIRFDFKLGEGGFGTVWQCTVVRPIGQPRELACKVTNLKPYHDKQATLKESIDALMREVDVLKGLDHENVAKLEHVFHIGDPVTGFPTIRLLMFIQLCDGDLERLINARTGFLKFSEDQTRYIMHDLCEGLKYLHEHNVVHLDIKPANVLYMMDPNTCLNRYKWTDFGLSQRFQPNTRPLIDAPIGTTNYMAPEMYTSMLTDATKADIYSLGVTMLQTLTGSVGVHSVYLKSTIASPISQLFWAFVSLSLSADVIDLAKRMTDTNWRRRANIYDVMAHHWYRGYHF